MTDSTNITVYKSYPDLCRSLNLPIKTGGAKTNQMNKLREHYNISVSGQSITLTLKTLNQLSLLAQQHEDAALVRDCIRGEGEFADRKCQAIMLLWEQLREDSEEDFQDFRDSSHFSKELISIGSGIRILCSRLGLVNEHYAERRTEINLKNSRNKRNQVQDEITETDVGFFREVSSMNKKVLDTLFGHLWTTSLAGGYKSFEVVFERGQIGVLPLDGALLISNLNEKTLEQFGCLSIQEVYAKGELQDYYLVRNAELKKEFGIVGIEDAYVTRTSEYLLSRYILKNVSKPAQKEMLRQLRLRENSVNIRKIRAKIEKQKEAEELALSGKANGFSGLDDSGAWGFTTHTEDTLEEIKKEREQINEREIRKKVLVEQYIRIYGESE